MRNAQCVIKTQIIMHYELRIKHCFSRLVRKIFLIIMLAGFIGYAGFNLAESVTPYVSIAEARATSNGVQVKGLLDKNFEPVQTCDEFTFSLQDEETGEVMRVKFDGIKPDQFDEAYHAKKLLIKCPSKYEGQQAR